MESKVRAVGKYNQKVMQLLLELLRVSLGTARSISWSPSEEEWNLLFELSQVQTIAGQLVDGLERLPDVQRPPTDLLLQWLGTVQMVEAQYARHKRIVKQVKECLSNAGIDVAFMKGLVCGSRYAHPKRRQCGDIDFVVGKENFSRSLDVLSEIGEVDRNLVHEHHGLVHVDEVTLEPHYKVHNFQNPLVDKAMLSMFKEVFPEMLVRVTVDDIELPTFPPAFECALLVGHMVNHVYAEGLGLRQVVDFMMFLQKEHKAVKTEQCMQFLKRMRMERAFRIFTCICENYLGMPNELMGQIYTVKEERFAAKMIEDIMKVGNFGRGIDYMGRHKLLIPIQSYCWVLNRCIKLGYLCPAEACWWPISKFTRYCKKRIFKKV